MFLISSLHPVVAILLGFLFGLALAWFFTGFPSRWALNYILSGIFVVWFVFALATGEDPLFGPLALGLTQFLTCEPIGFWATIAGFVVTLLYRTRRSRNETPSCCRRGEPPFRRP